MAAAAPITVSPLVAHSRPAVQALTRHTAFSGSSLSNGVKVAVDSLGAEVSPTATVGLWAKHGSRFEKAGQEGASWTLKNLLLHPSRACMAGAKKTGAIFSAYNGREVSGYYAQVPSQHAEEALKCIKTALETPLTSEELERLHPYARSNRRSQYTLAENAIAQGHSAAFHGCGMENNPFGPEDEAMPSLESINSFLQKNSNPESMAVVGTGGIQKDKFKGDAEALFGDLAAAGPVGEEDVRFTGCSQMYMNENIPRPHLYLGFLVPTVGEAGYWAMRMWKNHFGSWRHNQGYATGSVMGREMALGNLALNFDTHYNAYSDVALYGFRYEPPKDVDHYYEDPQKATRKVLFEMVRATQSMRDDDLLRARYLTFAEAQRENDGEEKLARKIGEELVTGGQRILPETVMPSLQSVSIDNMLEVGETWLYDAEPVLGAVGPCAHVPDYPALRRMTRWFRN